MGPVVKFAVALVVLLNHPSNAKIFERCELARILRNEHGLPLDEVANWVCIAQYQSGLNSSSYTGTLDSGAHGLFQISDVYWCSPPNKGWACGISCDKLRDDDLRDDILCIRQIYEEHQRISGDGFNAWTTYQHFCKGKADKFLQSCNLSDGNFSRAIKQFSGPYSNDVDNALTEYEPIRKPGPAKVYDRCELARELRYKHKFPLKEIATWVCIAWHESNFNTSAIGRLNADGSGDHGLFQISDIYWCSPPGSGWACGLSCDKLEDWDISDDVECIKTIYEEHKRISGDGFNAWAVYQPYCRERSEEYTRGCFDEIDDNSLDPYLTSESVTLSTKAYPYKPKKPTGKVYTPCELADELRYRHHIPEEQIATWVCIAKYESNFNTSAVGNGDHGLFQISDIYWCSPPGRGWACGLSCSDLEDNDITDDVQCIKKIYEEHQRLSGDGFKAWVVYPTYCNKGRAQKYIEECTKTTQSLPPTNVLPISQPAITAPTRKPIYFHTKQYATINRLPTTTKKPFTFSSFPSKNSLTTFRSGGFTFKNTSPAPTKSAHQYYSNSFGNGNFGHVNHYNSFKNPFSFSFGNAVAATNVHTTKVKPSIATINPNQWKTDDGNKNVFNFNLKTTGKPQLTYNNEPTSKPTTSQIVTNSKTASQTTRKITPKPTARTTSTKSTTRILTTRPTTKLTTTKPATRSIFTTKPSTKIVATRAVSTKPTVRTSTAPTRTTKQLLTTKTSHKTTKITQKGSPTPRPTSKTVDKPKFSHFSTTTERTTQRVEQKFSKFTTTTPRPFIVHTTPQSSTKSIFDIYFNLFNISPTQKREALELKTTKHSNQDALHSLKSSQTTPKTTQNTYQGSTKVTTTKSSKLSEHRINNSPTTPTIKQHSGNSPKTTTKSPFAYFTTKSPFSFRFITNSPSSRVPRSDIIPPGTYSSYPTKSPTTPLFTFLSAPLPAENPTPLVSEVTKSWFDEIFDRFRH